MLRKSARTSKCTRFCAAHALPLAAAFPLSDLLFGIGTAAAIAAIGSLATSAQPQAASNSRQQSHSLASASDASRAQGKGASAPPSEAAQLPPSRGGYPIIRREEVAKHKEKSSRVWVTYGEGVYDITDFIEAHPGGPHKIILAAGGALEPYWAMYAQHKQDQVRATVLIATHAMPLQLHQFTSRCQQCSRQLMRTRKMLPLGHVRVAHTDAARPCATADNVQPGFCARMVKAPQASGKHALQVYTMLEEMRIGTLPEEERAVATSDPFANDPARHESIVTRSEAPFNGETPLDWLMAHVTPNEYHYVRNHLPVPEVLPEAFELQARLVKPTL